MADAITQVREEDQDIKAASATAFGEESAEPVEGEVQAEPDITEVVSADSEALPEGVRASPLARRMAGTLGINLNQVSGSGPNGRITKADIESYQAAPRHSSTSGGLPCDFRRDSR